MFIESLGQFVSYLVNIIYTGEADFRQDTKWKTQHFESHLSAMLF